MRHNTAMSNAHKTPVHNDYVHFPKIFCSQVFLNTKSLVAQLTLSDISARDVQNSDPPPA